MQRSSVATFVAMAARRAAAGAWHAGRSSMTYWIGPFAAYFV